MKPQLRHEHFHKLLSTSNQVLHNASEGKANGVLPKPVCSKPEASTARLLSSPAPLLFLISHADGQDLQPLTLKRFSALLSLHILPDAGSC